MNFKPFYIKYENWMTDDQVIQVLDKAVKAGAVLYEDPLKRGRSMSRIVPSVWLYFGVDSDNETFFSDSPFEYGKDSDVIELTLDQVDSHLGLHKPKEITDLTNCAMRITNENGILGVDKLNAVLDASGKTFESIKFSQSASRFLLVGDSYITVSDEIPEGFKLIDFKYKRRKLEWSAIMAEEREIVMIGGEEYYADKVDAMFAAMKEAKVGGEVSVMGGGGSTPPELPPKEEK